MTDSIVHFAMGGVLIVVGMFFGSLIRDWLNKRQINKYGSVTVGDTVYIARELP